MEVRDQTKIRLRHCDTLWYSAIQCISSYVLIESFWSHRQTPSWRTEPNGLPETIHSTYSFGFCECYWSGE